MVDASVWVGALHVGDLHYARSRAFLEAVRASEETLLTPAFALPEVAGAISRRTGSPLLGRGAVRAMRRLPVLRILRVDDELVEEATRAAADLGLRGADSFYVAAAQQLAARLVTWDREQAERAARLVEVGPPLL